jgi:hypothetical protein
MIDEMGDKVRGERRVRKRNEFVIRMNQHLREYYLYLLFQPFGGIGPVAHYY